jgi:hypothetical protein
MMEERTWKEHCSKLEVSDNFGLVCPVCCTELDVSSVFTTLAKWGGFTRTGKTAEEYFSEHDTIIPKSNCEHLRYLGFLDPFASSFIDKNDLGKKFAEDPTFEEARTKEMYGGKSGVFREWLLENEDGVMVDLGTYWKEFLGTDKKGRFHDIKNAGLVAIFQDVPVPG